MAQIWNISCSDNGLRAVVIVSDCLLWLTCDGGEVDPHQQGEEAGDVSQDVAVAVGHGSIRVRYGRHPTFLQDITLIQVVTKQVLCNTMRGNGLRVNSRYPKYP